MGDEDQGQPKFFLQVLEKIEYLSLHTYVECRHWLVADDQRWVQHKCASNRNALALPPGELMRLALCSTIGIDANGFENLGD